MTVHVPVCVLTEPHTDSAKFAAVSLIGTVTCRQFPNLTFAPRKTCLMVGSNLALLCYHVTAFQEYHMFAGNASIFLIFSHHSLPSVHMEPYVLQFTAHTVSMSEKTPLF